MNNENGSNELFSENTPPAAAAEEKQPGTARTPGAEAVSNNSQRVLTEDTVIEETPIPDTDACGARSCGEFLKIQREKLNLSYAQVFEATRIKSDMVKALEEEDFSMLPQPVYVIAYVKRLCQFYNINNALAREFVSKMRDEIAFDVPEDFSKSVKGSDVSEENMRRIRNLALAAALVIFLFLVLLISGITLVVINLRKAENQPSYSENTLVELQSKPKLRITEL
jgi:hypothetical protein